MPALGPLTPAAAAFFAEMGPILAQAAFGMLANLIISSALDQDEPAAQQQADPGYQVNTQSMNTPIPLLYGTVRAGINRCFVATSGTNNKYLHIVGILGEGEIEGFSEQIGGVDPLYFNNQLYTEYGTSNVHYELFTGSADQNVCSTLHNAVPEWNDPLRHTAYIYIRLTFDRDKFQSVPTITVGLKGLKIYNPYTEVEEWTNNPALCAYEMMTRSATRGGFGISGGRIITSSIEAARAYCVTKGYTCDMQIVDRQPITDNLQLILNNFRGALVRGATRFSLKFRDLNEEATVMAFDESSVISDSFGVKSQDPFDTATAIRIHYMSEEGGDDGSSTWKQTNYLYSPPGEDASDSGQYQEKEVKCLGLSQLNIVQEMAYYYYERLKLGLTFSFSAGQRAAQLEPMDIITLTHPIPGWTAQYGRVESLTLNNDFTVSIACIIEDLGFYDGEYNPAVLPWYTTNLIGPADPPPSVSNVVLTEEEYDYRGRSFTRLVVTFDPPTDYPFWDGADIWVKIGESGEWKYKTKTEGDYHIDPVEEGTRYYLKLVSVKVGGARQADAEAYLVSKLVNGLTTLPSDLASMTAVPNGDSVSIFANPITDPNIEGYEVRLGDAWDGAIFISFNKNCSLRLNGVRPGVHAFWMSPKDNAGNYSANPVSATCQVFIPSWLSQLPTYGSWSWDFTGGTHDNTEHITYGSDDALKCSHTSGVLSGTWTSPTMDFAAVEKVRIWGNFITNFVSSSTTWDGVAPEGTTWEDLGADTKTWREIFTPDAAGKVEAILKFSTDNISWSDVSFFEVLCAEVPARYVKVEVTLTDPAQDSQLYLQELNMVAYTGPQE